MYETPDILTTGAATLAELDELVTDLGADPFLPSPASYDDDPELAMIDRRILAGLVTP
jgi:hypothetical protein